MPSSIPFPDRRSIMPHYIGAVYSSSTPSEQDHSTEKEICRFGRLRLDWYRHAIYDGGNQCGANCAPIPNKERVRDSLMAKKTKAAPAPVVDEDDDLELEELEDDEVEEAPVKKGKAKANGDDVVFGASDLAKLASTDEKTYDAKTIRTLLRRMARDGRLTREISPANRSRYSWTGPDDPEVKKILKAIKGGEIETARNEALQKLKDQKAAQRAAKAAAEEDAPKAKKKKVAPPPVDDDDEDVE